MSLITDFNKTPGDKAISVVKQAGGLPGAVNTLQQIKGVTDSINGIISSVNLLVDKIRPAQSNINTNPTPLQQEKAMTPKQTPDQDLNMDQFQKMILDPQGRKKLTKGLDQLAELVGPGATIKDLKEALESIDKKGKGK